MRRLIIITGANKGLGKEFFNLFHQNNNGNDTIVSISRRLSSEQENLVDGNENRFVFIKTDLSKLENTSSLKQLENYKENVDRVVFISNAGIVTPINNIGLLNEIDLMNSIYVNVISPAIIINYLFKIFEGKKIDIINISSGAATTVVEGWSAYCSGKAYIHMFIEALKIQEKGNNNVNIHNIDPGTIDTAMQQEIRNANVKGFTKHAEFVKLSVEGKLKDAKTIALAILTKEKLII